METAKPNTQCSKLPYSGGKTGYLRQQGDAVYAVQQQYMYSIVINPHEQLQ
jgi:hypothetical protein